MIEIGSPLRQKILAFFFTNPHEELYLREMARLLDVDPGNLAKEMIALQKEKIFKAVRRGSLKIYSLNKAYPLYPELKRIIEKSFGVEARLKKELGGIAGIRVAFIFGSFATEKYDKLSDIDLFFVGDPNEDILVKKISALEEYFRREINYNIFSLRDLCARLSKGEVFLKEIIEKPKIFIVGNKNELEKIAGGQKSPAKNNKRR
jgi:predicted nucleotidyltransferase